MPSSKNTSIALFGCGTWGSNWVRVLEQMGVLAAVADPQPAALDRVRQKYPNIRTTSSPSELLQDPSIDGVVIATPAPTHFETAKLCLQAGKHVLVEKPLALNLAQGQELVDLARRMKRVLMVGHLFEHHSAVLRLVELLRSGQLGRLQYVSSNQLNTGIVRDQENALWSLAPHDIGLVLKVVDQRPEEVWAVGSDFLTPGVQDMVTVHLKFAGNVRAQICVNWLYPFKERRLVVVGDKQMAVFDDGKPWPEKLTLYPHEIERSSGRSPKLIKKAGVPVTVTECEPLMAQARHFLECVSGGKEPLTSGASNLRVLETLEAAEASLKRNDLVIVSR